jgi:hypothetical protein
VFLSLDIYIHFENFYIDPLKRGFCAKLRMIPSEFVYNF